MSAFAAAIWHPSAPLTRRQTWGLAIGIFLLAAGPRLVVVWLDVVPDAPDTADYVVPAKNLVAGHGYSDNAGKPYSHRPPVYPLFLAAIFSIAGDSLRSVQIIQALLAAAGCAALALWMASRRGCSTGAATGILVSLDPILIPVPAFVLAEALGTIWVAGTVICLDQGLAMRRPGYLLATGVLGGASALTRPNAVLLVPWLLFTAWLLGAPRHRPDGRSWILSVGILAVCVGAWTTRNYLTRGEAIVLQERGFAEWVWRTTEYDFNWIPSGYDDPAHAEVERKFDALAAGHSVSERHMIFLRAAWQNVRNNPVLVLKRVAKANFWVWVESPGSHLKGKLRPLRWATLLFHQLQLLGLVFAVWALWRAGHLQDWSLWASTVVYFALSLSLLYPVPRFYIPLWPVVDALIVAGLSVLCARPSQPLSVGIAPPG